MKRIPTNTYLIISGTVAFIVIFLFAVIKIYELTLNEAKKSHQLQQMEMAKAATIGISTYLDHIVEDMRLLTFYEKFQNPDKISIRSNVDYFFNHYEQEAVKAIFIADENANIIYSQGESLPQWIFPLVEEQLDWAQKPENFDICWYSPVQATISDDVEKGMSFLMIIPLIKSINFPAQLKSKIVRSVGYLINFNELIQHFIEPLNLTKNDFAWVIDGNGRLIFHPRHTEMLQYSTKELLSDCMECHSSFEIQNRMLVDQASIGEYTIGDEPSKIMAYFPILLQNEKWVLVISTFLPDVTENLRNKFRLFFILGFIILAAIISFGLSLYYVNARRIRAEESKRQSEQIQQFEQQLNQASKLASIGELVDTVAHEINTPAGIISAQADALLLQQEPIEKNSEEIQIIKQQTKRISKYTRTLLGFSKRVTFNPRLIILKELLDECIYLLSHKFRAKKISVINNYSNNLPNILLDRDQIEQVFINLFNNAVDSFDSPGQIKIDAKIIHKSSTFEENISIEGIQIDFTDNGRGIKETDLNQIFEPFFSTKPPSEGTGLGLYISKSIIQRHRGKIDVKSKINKGTTFTIFLPLNFRGINAI